MQGSPPKRCTSHLVLTSPSRDRSRRASSRRRVVVGATEVHLVQISTHVVPHARATNPRAAVSWETAWRLEFGGAGPGRVRSLSVPAGHGPRGIRGRPQAHAAHADVSARQPSLGELQNSSLHPVRSRSCGREWQRAWQSIETTASLSPQHRPQPVVRPRLGTTPTRASCGHP